jgi:hypothetical protein
MVQRVFPHDECTDTRLVGEQLTSDSKRRGRAMAVQIDLLMMIAILSLVFSLFAVFGTMLLSDVQDTNDETEFNVVRVSDMLADDYLVATPTNATLDRDCAEAFFSRTPTTACGHQPGWSNDNYLHDALPLSAPFANVTVTDESGDIVSIKGTKLAMGETANRADVVAQTLYVALDANNDGNATIHRLTVQLW